MRAPTPYGPPNQPVFTSQHCALCSFIRRPSISAYTLGRNGRNGAPKQVEKFGVGSFRPASVPATLAVYPERKWYIACSVLRREIGGKTPKASAVRKMMFLGCPPTPGITALSMYSTG